jgi:hypothetical protein
MGKEITMTDEMLMSMSKFLRRAFVGRLEEDELYNCVVVIENEIDKRRVDAARKHRAIRR